MQFNRFKLLRLQKRLTSLDEEFNVQSIPENIERHAAAMYLILKRISDLDVIGDWAMPCSPQGDHWDAIHEARKLFGWKKPSKRKS